MSVTASQLVYEFQPTTPAGTSQSSPYVLSMPMPPLEVRYIEWVVPPGPQGYLGWQILCSGELVIPQNATWLVTDDEKHTWELDEQVQTGAWGFRGYNNGRYPHTVYLRFLLDPLEPVAGLDDLGLIYPLSDPALDNPNSPLPLDSVTGGLGLTQALIAQAVAGEQQSTLVAGLE